MACANGTSSRLAIIIVGLVMVLITPTLASHLTFQVEPKTSECFYEDLNANSPFEMTFEVLRGGLLDIKFQLYDPNRQLIEERMAFFNRADDQNDEEGKVSRTASMAGSYRFCFDNTMSRWTAKVVTFEVKSKRANKEEAAKLEHLGPMVDSVIKISDELDAIEKHQKHTRKREKLHYQSVKATNNRIQWMVMFSTVLLIGLSLFSLSHIQKWFNDDRRSGV